MSFWILSLRILSLRILSLLSLRILSLLSFRISTLQISAFHALAIGSSIMLGTAASGWAIPSASRQAKVTSAPTMPLMASRPEEHIRSNITCPGDIDALVPLMLRDVPSYANRVSSRAQVLERSFNPRGVVIAAAQATEDKAFNGSLPDDLEAHQLVPIFFTTLERQYVDGQAVRLQHYHWAFLSQTDGPEGRQDDDQEGAHWHLALMFSRLGDYPANQPVAPLRDSRQGSVGQALQLWLRDCNAGSIEE